MTVIGSQATPQASEAPCRAGPARAPDASEPASLWVVPLADPLVEALGFDPRSWYVEHFWLPVIGPTCTWLLRHVAAGLEGVGPGPVASAGADAAAGTGHGSDQPGGFTLEVERTALALGVGGRRGRHSPFGRAFGRCVAFDLARFQGPDTLAVRRMLPPLARRHLIRLPPALQEQHERWTAARHREPSLDQQRRRARRLALGLVALGEAFDMAEAQLLRWGVHPALTDETVRWARALRRP